MSAAVTTTLPTNEQYSFFDSYHYIWKQQRPDRTSDEVTAFRQHEDTADQGNVDLISFEDRVAIRSLFYAVVDDPNLRNILDGTLLPPPYDLRDLSQKRWSEKDIKAICSVLNPSLDLLVVNLPFNLALRLGAYDARLRAATRRLSWIFTIPFSLVEQRENSLAELRTAMGSNAGADAVSDAAKQEEVRRSKEERRRSVSRMATIGGFAILGGAALVVTGGLAAPIVGPAYAALVTATATTLGAIGAVGGAVLGTGALAAAFAAVVGVATHAAALAAVVTPALTAANLTAIFGVTGVSLGGYKAFRRTTDSGVFMLRSVDEVETFHSTAVGAAGAMEGTDGGGSGDGNGSEQGNDDVLKQLASTNQAVRNDGAAAISWDLSAVIEDNSRPGMVVPAHTRVVAMAHASNIPSVRRRHRYVVFAIANNLEGFELRLKAIKVLSGLWALTPPAQIPSGQVGIFACVNRFAHPTGAGFIVCYVATPVRATKAAASLRVWVRAEKSFLGAWALSAACEKAEQDFDPSAAEYWMDEHLSENSVTRRQQGVTLEMNARPFTYLKLYPATADATTQGRLVVFPLIELPQRQIEYGQGVKQRRKLGVSFVNRSTHTLVARDFGLVNGAQWPQTASPMTVNPSEASLTYFTNSSWSLEGAEAYYIVEAVNNYNDPVTPKYYVRVQFEVSSLNNINVAFASAYNIEELKTQPTTPTAPSSRQFNVELPAGLFFSLICVIDSSQYTLQVVVQDFVERPNRMASMPSERTTLSIGISGYSAIFDPRRPVRDQQIGLWQPVLRRAELLGPTEAYCLHWEDEYLTTFGDSIHVNLHVADTVTKKAINRVKKTVKTALTQGALFTGMHAFASLMGAFELPLYAVWATNIIDNNFATLSNRSAYTGKDLAAALLDTQRGNRPVTLVGFSFGARVIVECLRELEKVQAYHIVENAYLLGSTCTSDPELWRLLRRVVAGRLINVYTRQDWLLWTMYRLNRTGLKPMAGINPVNVPGVENVDVTPLISGHGDYAANLLPVLAAIPAEPTPATWSPQQHSGSPGVSVPLKNCESTVIAVRNSLHSYLTSTPYVAVGLKNCLLTDMAHYEPQIELLSMQLYGCFFDFMPPPLTDSGMASISGLLGEAESEMGAVVAFQVRLPPAAPRDLLVLLFLSSTPDGDMQMYVQPNLVDRRASVTETPAAVYERLCTIVAEICCGLEDVQRTCRAHGVDWESSGSAPYTQLVPVPLPDTFTDKHSAGCLRLELTRTDVGGVILTFVGLLTVNSTQLQQERFDERQFVSAFATLKNTRRSGNDGGVGSRNGLQMPVVADTHSSDHIQSQLRTIAAQLQGPDKSSYNTITPFVFVNCGTVPLYFCESLDDGTATAMTSATASTDGDAQDTAAYDALRAPQWSRFPPPEIPPGAFTVPTLMQGSDDANAVVDGRHVLAKIRYQTNNGECGFDIDFFSTTFPFDDTVKEAAAGGSLVKAKCTAVDDLPAVGEVSLFHSTISNVNFVMIMMTPRSVTETGDGDTDGDTVQSRLRNHGWYVV